MTGQPGPHSEPPSARGRDSDGSRRNSGNLLSELKRRKVYRVGVAYLAVALAGLEGASMVFPVIGLGAPFFNGLVVLVLLGFPLSIALAWTFDLTDTGIERTQPLAGGAARPDPDRWVRLKAAFVGAGFVGIVWMGVRLWQPLTGDPGPSLAGSVPVLAVLPFEVFSAGEEQSYFADGLYDEVTLRLGEVSGIRLTSRTSASHFRGSPLTAVAIADSLGADYVLEGSIRTGADSIVLTMQLVDARSDDRLWSESLAQGWTLEGLITLQRTLATRVASALGGSLGDAAARAPTDNLEAYNAYLRGIYHQNLFDTENWWAAVSHYERAVALDPDFGHAHARLAMQLAILNNYGLRKQGELFPRIREHAEAAVRLIPDDAQAHLAIMAVHWPIEWNWEAAREDMERALELNPSLVDALWAMGEWHGVIAGNVDLGLEVLQRAAQLDPYATRVRGMRMWVLMNGRRWEEAVSEGRAILQTEPGNMNIALSLVACLTMAGRPDEARAVFAPLLAAVPSPRPVAFATYAAWAGEETQAREILRRAVALKESGGSVPASGIAAAYSVLGDVDAALDWLERSFAEEGGIYYLRHADWDNVAPDPRFRAIWDRVGLKGLQSSLVQAEQ